LPSRRLSRAIRIIRNTSPVGLTSTAEGVTGTTIKSAIIIAEAIAGTAAREIDRRGRLDPDRNRPLCAHSQALPCGSTSSRITCRPRAASAQARFTAIVVLPVPPFRLPMAMIWPILQA
jgi:hypothetical protein